jgi:hypothetical protein
MAWLILSGLRLALPLRFASPSKTERIGLNEGATVVLDRGMAFDENIAELQRRKLSYVVASTSIP